MNKKQRIAELEKKVAELEAEIESLGLRVIELEAAKTKPADPPYQPYAPYQPYVPWVAPRTVPDTWPNITYTITCGNK